MCVYETVKERQRENMQIIFQRETSPEGNTKISMSRSYDKSYRPNAHPRTCSIEVVQSLPHLQARLFEHSL